MRRLDLLEVAPLGRRAGRSASERKTSKAKRVGPASGADSLSPELEREGGRFTYPKSAKRPRSRWLVRQRHHGTPVPHRAYRRGIPGTSDTRIQAIAAWLPGDDSRKLFRIVVIVR
jgi:hypothetical protein